MNLGLLTNSTGISSRAANSFVNNSAISTTTQTLIVADLKLGNIPGQGEDLAHCSHPPV